MFSEKIEQYKRGKIAIAYVYESDFRYDMTRGIVIL